jgi:hypothetical protein
LLYFTAEHDQNKQKERTAVKKKPREKDGSKEKLNDPLNQHGEVA